MFGNASWKFALAAAGIFGIVASQICTAQNCHYPEDVQMGGIWVYPADRQNITLTIINLTPYELTSTPRSAMGSVALVVYGDSWVYPFQRNMEPITVAPYRTVIWKEGYAGPFYKPHFWGHIRFALSTPLWAHSFDVAMTVQNPEGWTDQGTWISLQNSSVNDTWCAAGVFCGGVWATPRMIGHYDMHNIMTLTSPDLVVALYSPDNLKIVLVVREATGDQYDGWMLDWVDNGGSSVPGDCNN